MTTGERIKARRKQINMSAEALADKLGLAPSTVYRYEKGDIEKMPMDCIGPLAEALYTTPAYLMGWEGANEPQVLADQDRLILEAFHSATPDIQKAVLRILED